MKLTRRALTRAALAAPFVSSAAATAVSADGHGAPKLGLGDPAVFSAPLGRYKITAVLDGIVPLGRNFFSASDQIDTVLAENGMGPDALPTPISAFLLQSEDRTILIDAGMGADFDGFGPGFGRATPGLAALGVAPEDIDTVIVTHLHIDHIGGMLRGGAVVFPNAEVIISSPEAGFWTDSAVLAAAPAEAKAFFELAASVVAAYGSQVTLVGDGAEVAPGVTTQFAVGHTPGHMMLNIDGGDRQLMMVGDIFHVTELQTALPRVQFGFDVDPATAADTRVRIFDQLAADKTLIAGSHVHFPGFGRILPLGDAYRFVPATWA